MNTELTHTTTRSNLIRMTLYGSELPPEAPCIVYMHGFKGFKDWGFVPFTGNYFAENGIRFLAFNFSHNGIGGDNETFSELLKFKKNTFSLEVSEAREVIDATLAGKFFEIDGDLKLGVIGHSRGGGIALCSATDNAEKVLGLCTWAAISTFDRYAEIHRQTWKQQGYLPIVNSRTGQVFQLGLNLLEDLEANIEGELNIKQKVMDSKVPLCIIHGGDDEAVSENDARAIYEWAEWKPAEMHIIDGTGHTFGSKHPWEGKTKAFDHVLTHSFNFFKQQFSK